eukprot:2835434-Amphidinium_carterae.2
MRHSSRGTHAGRTTLRKAASNKSQNKAIQDKSLENHSYGQFDDILSCEFSNLVVFLFWNTYFLVESFTDLTHHLSLSTVVGYCIVNWIQGLRENG